MIEAETVPLKVPTVEQYHNGQIPLPLLVKIFSKVFQSTMESLVKRVLEPSGRSKEETDQLLQELWTRCEQNLGEKPELVTNRNQYVCVALILKKI